MFESNKVDLDQESGIEDAKERTMYNSIQDTNPKDVLINTDAPSRPVNIIISIYDASILPTCVVLFPQSGIQQAKNPLLGLPIHWCDLRRSWYVHVCVFSSYKRHSSTRNDCRHITLVYILGHVYIYTRSRRCPWSIIHDHLDPHSRCLCQVLWICLIC